jgi:hypothetical protein
VEQLHRHPQRSELFVTSLARLEVTLNEAFVLSAESVIDVPGEHTPYLAAQGLPFTPEHCIILSIY